MTLRATAGLVLAGLTVLGAGCRNTADGAREDARRAAREAQKAADGAKKELDRAAREAKRAAEEAQRAAEDARRDVQKAAEGARRDVRESAADLGVAKQLLDVRTALAVSREISSASAIEVRAGAAGRTVILSGSVPSAAEKDAAGRIARGSADGLRVDNRLKIATPP